MTIFRCLRGIMILFRFLLSFFVSSALLDTRQYRFSVAVVETGMTYYCHMSRKESEAENSTSCNSFTNNWLKSESEDRYSIDNIIVFLNTTK